MPSSQRGKNCHHLLLLFHIAASQVEREGGGGTCAAWAIKLLFSDCCHSQSNKKERRRKDYSSFSRHQGIVGRQAAAAYALPYVSVHGVLCLSKIGQSMEN
jgi:hypothetical protein